VTPPDNQDATATSDPPLPLTSPSTPVPAEVPPAPPPPASPLDRAFLTNQSGVATLILVRHGQQVWPQSPNAAASEWVDPPLSDTGRRQAEVVGAALAREVVDAVYSSHLRRALETGREIGRHHGMQPQVFTELREIEMFRDLPAGTRMRDAIAEPILRGVQERFVHERCWDVYPFTEGSAAFRNRVVNTIEGIVATHSGQRVVIACHGGVINAYIGHILGLREDMFFRPAHASVSRVLARDGRRVVQSLNEVHHLGEVHTELVTT
jgi:2,3-bisphosphoglycerate-dependent phosphoglycerate mutase